MRNRIFTLFSSVISIFLLSVILSPTQAFFFDKNLIISDQEMENTSAFSLKGVQSFLVEKGSVLANVKAIDLDGREKTAAEIIFNVSMKHGFNPMFFLVMAQKESSAITSSTMTYAIENWILGYGRCDSCSEEQAAPYRGLANQINAAGDRIRNSYLKDIATKGHTISGWGPGITKTTIDGIAVTPENKATAALYTYNPWVGAYGGGDPRWGANSLFAKLWQEWYGIVKYPNGTVLQIGKTLYLVQDGKKRPFASTGAFLSNFSTKDIISTTTVVGEQYKDGTPIFFPNYSLLKTPQGGVYLIVDGKKRPIKSPQAFRALGFHQEEVISASWKEINAYPDGAELTAKSIYPTGVVLQAKETKQLFYIDPEGNRHPVANQEIVRNQFPTVQTLVKKKKTIKQFPIAEQLMLKDGTLVKSPNSKAVYVIENGKKRPFESKTVFNLYGYKWGNIINVSDVTLELHPTGKLIKKPKTR